MIVRSITLKDLLDVAQGEGDRPSSGMPNRSGTGDVDESIGPIQAVWRDSDAKVQAFPIAIIVEPNRRRSFLAWVVTYLPQLRPFTAFCRVWQPDTFRTYCRIET